MKHLTNKEREPQAARQLNFFSQESKTETITSKNGNQTWNIISKESRPAKNRNRTYFTVACSKCGHNITGEKSNIQAMPKCPDCTPKPVALKTDETGSCITICRIGQLEHIHRLITEENMSEREASTAFIEAVQAHALPGDPITDDLTVEKIRSQFRRDSGRLKDKKNRVEPTHLKTQNITENVKRYRVAAEPESIQNFLEKHMPGYKLIKTEQTNLND